MSEPCHEVLAELTHGAKRVHLASLDEAGCGPHQFHIADSANQKKPNSFRDLAVARASSGDPGLERADETSNALTLASQLKSEKLRALAKSR